MEMVDIGRKDVTEREAVVEGTIYLKTETIRLIKEKGIPKGDVCEAARIAGTLAAKKTPDLIPLCHPIPIEFVKIEFDLKEREIKIKGTVRARARTGVEMESLTAVAVAALTIYDMCKPVDKEMVISDVRLIRKTGGKSGTYIRNQE